ncbi:hypothetical protein C8J56DRAFT_931339 [Mycena floridula]|nr:hypothetical protein C8J56DRAFT_931339 [Mycena floridula]
MALLDTITDGLRRVIPAKSTQPSTSLSGGGHGMVVEDDMIVPKTTIVFHASQIFFNFLAMACFASVASFQAKFHVGPSGLSGFTIFITVLGMFLSAFMLIIPVAYEKYDKFVTLARALKELRVSFILTGAGTTASLLISFIVTISAWTQPGCKNAANDPHAKELGDDFTNGLPGWCNTKKAGAVFLWLAFVFWAASLGYLIYAWRTGKLHGPRDPPFQHPNLEDGREDDEDDDAEYHVIPAVRQQNLTSNYDTPPNPFADSNRYSSASGSTTNVSSGYNGPASRPSMDAYGAFSDPAPSGFGAPASGRQGGYGGAAPVIPEPDFGPKVSRTMQYADPYAAVRANIAGGNPPPASGPPSYENNYQGYR